MCGVDQLRHGSDALGEVFTQAGQAALVPAVLRARDSALILRGAWQCCEQMHVPAAKKGKAVMGTQTMTFRNDIAYGGAKQESWTPPEAHALPVLKLHNS